MEPTAPWLLTFQPEMQFLLSLHRRTSIRTGVSKAAGKARVPSLPQPAEAGSPLKEGRLFIREKNAAVSNAASAH